MDDVRWLSDEEQHWWRAYRDGTARLLDVLAHDLERDTGLSLGEYEVLVRLSERRSARCGCPSWPVSSLTPAAA